MEFTQHQALRVTCLTHWPLEDVAVIWKYRIVALDLTRIIVLRWMLQNCTNEKSTLVQVMAWCCEATKSLPVPMLTQINIDQYEPILIKSWKSRLMAWCLMVYIYPCSGKPASEFMLWNFLPKHKKHVHPVHHWDVVSKATSNEQVSTYMYIFFLFITLEILIIWGPGKVLENSWVLIDQNTKY